jgi:hypothetical protein
MMIFAFFIDLTGRNVTRWNAAPPRVEMVRTDLPLIDTVNEPPFGERDQMTAI